MFSDLRAMATTEARVVLGAAVADDVMGLVVLTVVVRLVTEGSVSLLSVAGIIAGAVAFLVVGVVVGMRVAPPLFRAVARLSRSSGTLVALALAFTLAFAELADVAKLAPIVGAFVAGIALNRSDQADRIRRELTPVGHLFIPVFFLQIGIDADIAAFGRLGVLRDAAILLVVAVVGKLVSPLGAIGTPGDKPLIGLGMLPRGEVGLIFATIGLQTGVLGDDLYAALLLVVLVTTLATPQLLKVRYARLSGTRQRHRSRRPDTPEPDGGWLEVSGDEVRLRATPPDAAALPVALAAAVAVGRNRPGADLLDWLAGLPDKPLAWDAATRDQLLDVVERGNARGWRFLETTGVLDRALPELAEALRRRARRAVHHRPAAVVPVPGDGAAAPARRRRPAGAGDPGARPHRPPVPGGAAGRGVRRDGATRWLAPGAPRPHRDRPGRPGRGRGGGGRPRPAVVGGPPARARSARRRCCSSRPTSRPPSGRACSTRVSASAAMATRRGRSPGSVLHELVQAALDRPELTGPDARGLATSAGSRRPHSSTAGAGGVERVADAPQSYVLASRPTPSPATPSWCTPLPGRPRRGSAPAPRAGNSAGGSRSAPATGRALLATVTSALAAAGLDVAEAVVVDLGRRRGGRGVHGAGRRPARRRGATAAVIEARVRRRRPRRRCPTPRSSSTTWRRHGTRSPRSARSTGRRCCTTSPPRSTPPAWTSWPRR